MNKQVKIVAATVLSMSALLAACGGPNESKGKTTKSQQTLNLIQTAEIPSMDTSLATDAISFEVMTNVMEGLYRLDNKDLPIDGMADKYEVSKDGKTYTFHIRDNAKWSNGDTVTAKDFEYSWKKSIDPEHGSEYAYIMYDIKNAEAINTKKVPVDQLGVKAIDDHTLQVKLERPVPYFLSLVTFPTFYPQNEKFVREQGKDYALDANTGVYNGPFTLSEWKHDVNFKLSKNTNYWDKSSVKLKEINYNIAKDIQAGVNLFETGNVDRVNLTSEFVDKYKGSKDLKQENTPSVFFIRFNEKIKELANPKVRAALSMAFDKESLTSVLLNDGSAPANYIVPKGLTSDEAGKDFRDINGDLVTYNVDEAKKIWEEAKKEAGFDTLTLELLNSDTDTAKKTGEFLKGELEKNLPGLTVEIKQQPFAQKLDLESKMDYQMTVAGWGPDYPDPMTFLNMFITGSSYNQMNYSNPKYDKEIKFAQENTTIDKIDDRWTALLNAEKILMDDHAIAPIYQRGRAYVEKEYVKGIVKHQFGGDYTYKWVEIKE